MSCGSPPATPRRRCCAGSRKAIAAFRRAASPASGRSWSRMRPRPRSCPRAAASVRQPGADQRLDAERMRDALGTDPAVELLVPMVDAPLLVVQRVAAIGLRLDRLLDLFREARVL